VCLALLEIAGIGNAAIVGDSGRIFYRVLPAAQHRRRRASLAVGPLLLLTFINLGGIGIFSLVQNAFTILKLIPLPLIATCGRRPTGQAI
jgi:hypothetical protein